MIQETHLDQEPGAFTKGRDTQESTQRGTYEQEKPRSNDVRKGEKHRFGWEQTLLILEVAAFLSLKRNHGRKVIRRPVSST